MPLLSEGVLEVVEPQLNLLYELATHPLEMLNGSLGHLIPNAMKSKSFNPATDVPDLSSKVVLITGGNAGLGKQTVLNLARHRPAHIYLAARTAAKAEAAIAEVHTAVPDARITFLELDLASLVSVAAAARTFCAQNERLDVLILNAGIMAVPAATTADGYEIQFGTNYLGHFLLVRLLDAPLRAAAAAEGTDARVVVVSSEAHRLARRAGERRFADQERLKQLGPWQSYGVAKLAGVLFAREMARRRPDWTTVSLHPGVISTGLYGAQRGTNVFLRWGMWLSGALWASIEDGAKNQTWAATCDVRDLEKGAYYTPVGTLAKGSSLSNDRDLAKELWEWSDRELERHGY